AWTRHCVRRTLATCQQLTWRMWQLTRYVHYAGLGARGLRPGGEATPSGTACRDDDDDGGQAAPPSHQEKRGQATGEREEEQGMTTLKERAVTGSRLPDCAHACGACAPCKRVMVSFRCAEASESCPIAYRCMCRGRFFRVPTL
uniref:Epidermal patterning factor-like protein n=1 Tax=Aegilops tauschii subsp. strangulata TaxID=200361 RepID=A0A453C494_AEGTS